MLSGELDLASAADLRMEVAETISTGEGLRVALDLRKVTFMDSSGLYAVLEARRLCRARGHDLQVVGVSAPVWRLFELAGVLDVVPLAPGIGPE